MKRVPGMLAVAALALALPAAAQQGWRATNAYGNDIGIGPKGEVWIVGNEPAPSGFGIHRLDGVTWTRMPGDAVRIDVGPYGPWVVNSTQDIYAWNNGNWLRVPGKAGDVGIGAQGTVWVIGNNAEVGGYDIYRFDNARRTFDKIPGSALRIDVDREGNAWVVNNKQQVYRFQNGAFAHVPGIAAVDVGIGAYGQVFVVKQDGNIAHYTSQGWVQHDADFSAISVDSAGRPWGVQSGSKQIVAAAAAAPAAPPPPPPVSNTPTPTAPPTGVQNPDGWLSTVNETQGFVWVTVYVNRTPLPQEIIAAGCIPPGEARRWGLGMAHKLSHAVRAEVTNTPNCAALTGNRHVRCDTKQNVPTFNTVNFYYRAVLREDRAAGTCGFAAESARLGS